MLRWGACAASGTRDPEKRKSITLLAFSCSRQPQLRQALTHTAPRSPARPLSHSLTRPLSGSVSLSVARARALVPSALRVLAAAARVVSCVCVCALAACGPVSC